MVEKRTGVYDCVRYKGQPPAQYERYCIYTQNVKTVPLSGPTRTADWYCYRAGPESFGPPGPGSGRPTVRRGQTCP